MSWIKATFLSSARCFRQKTPNLVAGQGLTVPPSPVLPRRMTQPSLSVVIPALDAAATLPATLAALESARDGGLLGEARCGTELQCLRLTLSRDTDSRL